MKRQATEQVRPIRQAKHPRTTLERPTGGNSSASQFEGMLSSWVTIAGDIRKFAGETIAFIKDVPKNIELLPLSFNNSHTSSHGNGPPNLPVRRRTKTASFSTVPQQDISMASSNETEKPPPLSRPPSIPNNGDVPRTEASPSVSERSFSSEHSDYVMVGPGDVSSTSNPSVSSTSGSHASNSPPTFYSDSVHSVPPLQGQPVINHQRSNQDISSAQATAASSPSTLSTPSPSTRVSQLKTTTPPPVPVALGPPRWTNKNPTGALPTSTLTTSNKSIPSPPNRRTRNNINAPSIPYVLEPFISPQWSDQTRTETTGASLTSTLPFPSTEFLPESNAPYSSRAEHAPPQFYQTDSRLATDTLPSTMPAPDKFTSHSQIPQRFRPPSSLPHQRAEFNFTVNATDGLPPSTSGVKSPAQLVPSFSQSSISSLQQFDSRPTTSAGSGPPQSTLTSYASLPFSTDSADNRSNLVSSSRSSRAIPSRFDHRSVAESTLSPSSASVMSSSLMSIPSSSNHTTLYGGTSRSAFFNGIPRKYQNREHIYAKVHKALVQEDRTKTREEMTKELYNLQRSSGYSADYLTFQSYLHYRAKLEKLGRHDVLSPSPSLVDLRSSRAVFESHRRHSFSEDLNSDFLARALEKAREALNGPKPPKPFIPSFDELRLKIRAKDEEIERRLRGPKRILPATLPREDEATVDSFLSRRGIVSKFAKEQVTDRDLSRLKPRQWLNDEVINFYGQLIMSRSDACKENPSINGAGKNKSLNVHYFSTFFWAKLKGEGYERGRLAKWTKKFDIFQKDIILIPVNHENTHWTGAAINFRRKRVESYDSMNMDHKEIYKLLRAYLDAEHRNKKKKPFDFTGWEDHTLPDTPQQENGFDCGVFTCQFLETLARGEDAFDFHQRNIPYLRRKMIWEIGNATLRDDP